MKILHVVPTYLPAVRYGGPIFAVHGLCRALAARGHEIHVATTNVDGPGESKVPLGRAVDIDGVNVWYFATGIGRRVYRSPAMRQYFRRHIREFDLLHLHSIFLWPTSVAARVASNLGVPYLVAPRGMLDRKLVYQKSRLVKVAWLNLIERRTLAKAAALHVTTALEATEARRFEFSLPPCIEVPNGTDTGTAYEDLNVSDHIRSSVLKGQYVLFLGRINWKKGLDRIIPAIARTSDIRFLIAGNDEEGYLTTVNQLIDKHSLRDRVDYVGYVSGADKLFLLQKAIALVAPSYSENFGNVVIEAMARKCPVIVTPEVGLADLVNQSGSGLVTPGTSSDLAENIDKISRNPSLARSMGDAGAKTVSAKFEWDIVGQLMAAAYSRLLGSEMEIEHG